MEKMQSLQEIYAPKNACFGCGPANAAGLQIRSFPRDTNQNQVEAFWQPKAQYEAFPGVLNGGIIGALLDCHSNWTAAWHLMKKAKMSLPPCTVTAEYTIKLLRPTPTSDTIQLVAEVVESTDTSAWVEAKLLAKEKVCATCRGRFVTVSQDHPGYYRW